MEKRALTVAIISLVAGIAIGFLIANRLNRTELESLRSENARLKTPADKDPDDGPTLSNEEIQARIKRADDTPTDLEYQKNLGTALYRYASMKKDVPLLNESTRLLKRVQATDPSGFDINVALGNAYFDIGYFGQDSSSFATARQYYETALRSRPDAAVRTDYGLTFFLQDPPDHRRAAAEFAAALKSDPKNEKALEFSVQSYLKLGDQASARRALEALRAVNGSSPSLAGLESAIAASSQPAK